MEIRLDDLSGKEIAELLSQHHQDMLKHSPPESVHALDLSRLKSADITFWSVWSNGQLAGCGALKEIDKTHGEIKSMRTSIPFLRQGIAANMLEHILSVAKQRGYKKISLETGSMAAFIPAIKLYQRFGFIECQPFADYQLDPYSVYMTKMIII